MGVIETKTFMSGNSVAVRLPKELGMEAGVPVTIEQIGNVLRVTPIIDPAEEKRKLLEMLDEIDKIWEGAPEGGDRGQRDKIEFPDRPGL